MDWLQFIQDNILAISVLIALGLGLQNILQRRKSTQELERDLAEPEAKPTKLNSLSWLEMAAFACWVIGGIALFAFDSKVSMLFFGFCISFYACIFLEKLLSR
ncbi:hypothetical protein [Motilimonas eburnea]|uniref:hypothetical protein n=1 Tax=Motilimonas eburnea TaxID=1737488 RepID=UPI001E49B4D4|nr:hypothetical protein [Motilimonas eburnea]MCE2571851.1 hypothetical protein [Motilimonas eburnea]